TGQLPFVGSFDEVVILKQTQLPPSPATFVDGLPEDLVSLCMDLLDPRPSQRTSGPGILDHLQGQVARACDVRDANRPLPLMCRESNLLVLDSAYASVTNRQPSTVLLFGRTGTGKTTLIRAFLESLGARGDTVILSGRCSEREWVPFKAVDSLVDG